MRGGDAGRGVVVQVAVQVVRREVRRVAVVVGVLVVWEDGFGFRGIPGSTPYRVTSYGRAWENVREGGPV